ncbi:hypothetical protein [Sphingomonas sp.]|uniref:hypothetical protein n=1 Tax=Sphingomonas sp. TaxID=28214 RepID=UPI003F7FE3BC
MGWQARLGKLARTGKLEGRGMIDNFALAISHGLMALAILLLLRRRDLDDERPEPPSKIKRR